MIILAEINYDDNEVLTFDPEKVLKRIKLFFDKVEIDTTDYSRKRLERTIKLANEEAEEPSRSDIINQILANNRRIGPAFRFKVFLDGETEVSGNVSRYLVKFSVNHEFSNENEKLLANFLKSLNYGSISSFTETDLFCVPCKKIKGQWLLYE
jgi:uncharacterized protein YecE (DUF72 family)